MKTRINYLSIICAAIFLYTSVAKAADISGNYDYICKSKDGKIGINWRIRIEKTEGKSYSVVAATLFQNQKRYPITSLYFANFKQYHRTENDPQLYKNREGKMMPDIPTKHLAVIQTTSYYLVYNPDSYYYEDSNTEGWIATEHNTRNSGVTLLCTVTPKMGLRLTQDEYASVKTNSPHTSRADTSDYKNRIIVKEMNPKDGYYGNDFAGPLQPKDEVLNLKTDSVELGGVRVNTPKDEKGNEN